MCGDLFFFLLFHFGVVDELFAETFQFARCQGVAQKIHKSVVCFCFHSCRVLRVDAFVSSAKIKKFSLHSKSIFANLTFFSYLCQRFLFTTD